MWVTSDIVSMLPTGEWRRSLNDRLSKIEMAVLAWVRAGPTPDERVCITADTIKLFSEAIEVR
ncbi:MAG: hypothetical protein ACLQBL_27065 [Polyangiaceae bacterium]